MNTEDSNATSVSATATGAEGPARPAAQRDKAGFDPWAWICPDWMVIGAIAGAVVGVVTKLLESGSSLGMSSTSNPMNTVLAAIIGGAVGLVLGTVAGPVAMRYLGYRKS